MDNIEKIAAANQQRARSVIRDSGVIEAWESIGAEVRQVGSLRMGLMMTHRDIDFHIYSSPVDIAANFTAMARLSANPRIEHVEYRNLLDTPEHCLEWHAWYRDRDNELWQLDMIHILRGSTYDGYFERMADRIVAVLTPETREAILRIKYETPDDVKIMGVEYYQAVIRDGVRTFDQMTDWRREHPVTGVVEWIP